MKKYFYTYLCEQNDLGEYLQSYAAYDIETAEKRAKETAVMFKEQIKGLFETNDPSIKAEDQLCNDPKRKASKRIKEIEASLARHSYFGLSPAHVKSLKQELDKLIIESLMS